MTSPSKAKKKIDTMTKSTNLADVVMEEIRFTTNTIKDLPPKGLPGTIMNPFTNV